MSRAGVRRGAGAPPGSRTRAAAHLTTTIACDINGKRNSPAPEGEALLAMDPIPDLPIDPSTLSRDPEVGRAYLEDPLVWHGPFRRATLEALFAAVRTIAAGPRLGRLPTLWLHGEDDALTPLAETRAAMQRVRGERLESIIYPGARHEVLNETNRGEVLAAVTCFIDRALEGR